MTHVLVGGHRIEPSAIARFEETFGVKVPESLKALVMENDGARIRHGYIPTMTEAGPEVASFDALYAFEPRDGGDGISEVRKELAEVYPGYLVFGMSGDGDQIAFDVREGDAEPAVVAIRSGLRDGDRILALGGDLGRTLAAMLTLDDAEDACAAMASADKGP